MEPSEAGRACELPMESVTLPDKLWLHIFQSFDYFDLKSCRSVNKQLHRLSSDPMYDVILFRTSNAMFKGRCAVGRPWLIHPAFDHLLADRRDGTKLVKGKSKVFRLATSNGVALEYTTWPPVEMMVIHMMSTEIEVIVKESNGVTIGSVMKAIDAQVSKQYDRFWDQRNMYRWHPADGVSEQLTSVYMCLEASRDGPGDDFIVGDGDWDDIDHTQYDISPPSEADYDALYADYLADIL